MKAHQVALGLFYRAEAEGRLLLKPGAERILRSLRAAGIRTALATSTAEEIATRQMRERGLLVPGYAADITVFNPDTIADLSTYAKPHTFPAGIEHVFVNGVHTIKNGSHTGVLAGVILDNAHLNR